MRRHVSPNAEPGTGTQIHVEAVETPLSDPNFDVDEKYPLEVDEAKRFRIAGRTWICGDDYWDDEYKDIVTLVEVVRKSSWCSTTDASEGPVYLHFECEDGDIMYPVETAMNSDTKQNPCTRFSERRSNKSVISR